MRVNPFLVASVACLVCGAAAAQFGRSRWGSDDLPTAGGPPEAEFQMGRLYFPSGGCAGSRGWCNPWWKIDYPDAEAHFLPAVERMTRVEVAPDSRRVTLDDDNLFDYPWLLLQQPGRGNWHPQGEELARLREYLERGGFLVVDDFHGEYEWAAFRDAIGDVLPGRVIIDIPDNDQVLNIVFSLDKRTQIPGERHLYYQRMEGPPHWRGIYDDHGRLMVAINHNSDMGDAWEHADDPRYPAPMTATAYRFGVNYVVYAMTH
jgi:Domain of unknown function (DUF4159)